MTRPNDDNLADLDRNLDRATGERLSRLRTMPVDTSRLKRSLASIVPAPSVESSSAQPFRLRLPRAVAAGFLALAITVVAIILSTTGGPVLASAAQMVAVHNDIVAGRVAVTRVDSIDAANRALAALSPRSPTLPAIASIASTQQAQPPAAHVMACCMRSVKDKNLACVLLMRDGVPVTMSVAAADDMRSQTTGGERVERGGVTYHVQVVDHLTMVACERDGRWVCLIGELPAMELMDLSAGLRFD